MILNEKYNNFELLERWLKNQITILMILDLVIKKFLI